MPAALFLAWGLAGAASGCALVFALLIDHLQ
jgi:hypothetical protein